MPIVVNCRLKLEILATRWEKHGDHPRVMHVPDHVNISGVEDRSKLGCVEHNNQTSIFAGPIWIIDSGGNTFAIDDNYFMEYYEIINEVKEPESTPEPTKEIEEVV